MVYGVGINDMPKGWTSKKNLWNYLVYQKWFNMLRRCYDENYHKNRPTYKKCIVCKRWLVLSNFVEDICRIDGYNKKLFLNRKLELDKDIKSNGTNKEYSLENCMFVTKSENSKQAAKTRDNSYCKNEDRIKKIIASQNKKTAQYDKNLKLIKFFESAKLASEETGINRNDICQCCRGERKTAGGYIWKYVEEE